MLKCIRFFIAEDKPAIVAAMHHNAAGIYYEQDAPVVVANWRDHVSLASAARSCLERFSFRDTNLRNHKRTEWPSYIASNCASTRDFERSYLRISLSAVNEAELFYDASAQPPGEDDLVLHVTINRHGSNDEMGRKLLRLFNSCSAWVSNSNSRP